MHRFPLSIALVIAASSLSIPPTSAQETGLIPVAALPQAFSMIGSTPEKLHERFGRPAYVEQSFRFATLGGKASQLMQAFDVEGGGRVGFLFVDHYRVAGVFFDNLDSTRYLAARQFFAKAVPRGRLMEECVQSDFSHALPGDPYGWPVEYPPPAVAVATQKWALSTGGMLFLQYRLDGHYRKVYDPVAGKDQILPPRNLDKLRLVAIGWFPLPGSRDVGDVHPTSRNSDFSTLTTSYPSTPCFVGSK